MATQNIIIISLLIIIAGGITYDIVDTGTNRRCKTGWEYNPEDNKYYCDDRSHYCVSIRDSANTPNYWCDEGKATTRPRPLEGGVPALKYSCPVDGNCTEKLPWKLN